MEIAALTILIIFSAAGFIAIFFTTFGTLIILIGSGIYAVMTNFSAITAKVLGILFVLYVFGEAMEYVFVILGAKKLGASNRAIAGAIVGGIVGGIVGAGMFGFGVIIGTFAGIFVGAFLVELIVRGNIATSFKAGVGSLFGRLLASRPGGVFSREIEVVAEIFRRFLALGRERRGRLT